MPTIAAAAIQLNRNIEFPHWLRTCCRLAGIAIRTLAPFVVPLVIEYVGWSIGQTELLRRAFYADMGVWVRLVFACGLGTGLLLLARVFRWYAIGMAVVYLPAMYAVMIYFAIGLEGGI